jgi:DNA polymerase/3'-5' exonuclease PolX
VSATATKLNLLQAREAAARFRALFEGCYERWEFAGSVRRCKPECGDIEHVVIPKRTAPREALLIADSQTVNAVRERTSSLVSHPGGPALHSYGGISRFGDRYIGLDFEDRLHEIFMCSPENWGCILAIRTGSAEFSRGLVSRLPRSGYRQRDGYLHNNRGRVPCYDEETFFSCAGLAISAWPPQKREAVP